MATAKAKRTPAGVSGLSLWVPGRPISVNSAYGVRARGGKYLKGEAVTWRYSVWATFRAHPERARFVASAALPLRVRCTFYGVRGDADNYLKVTIDGLKLALGIDDRHMTPITAHVERGRAQGQGQGARIEVWAAERRKGEAA